MRWVGEEILVSSIAASVAADVSAATFSPAKRRPEDGLAAASVPPQERFAIDRPQRHWRRTAPWLQAEVNARGYAPNWLAGFSKRQECRARVQVRCPTQIRIAFADTPDSGRRFSDRMPRRPLLFLLMAGR